MSSHLCLSNALAGLARGLRCAAWAAAGALVLSGCGSLSGLDGSSTYACKAPDGVQCQSVSGTYYNAVKNNLPSQSAAGAARSKNPVPAAVASPTRPSPLRSPPKVLGLWVKPWKDADGDLFDEGRVYIQVDSGDWLIEHVQRRAREAYAPVRAPAPAPKSMSKPASEVRPPSAERQPWRPSGTGEAQ